MGKTQKILTAMLWVLMVVIVAVGVVVVTRANRSARAVAGGGDAVVDITSAQSAADPAAPKFDAPPFALTDQNGKAVTSDDLRGKVYVADFIFTNCAGPCPMMTAKMAELQAAIRHPDVRLVSFTVDAERDTPAVLKEYAQRYNADDNRWLFLTGTVEQMKDVAVGYKIAAQKEADESVTHSTHFLLIGRDGKVAGIFRNSDEDGVKKLAAAATELAEQATGK